MRNWALRTCALALPGKIHVSFLFFLQRLESIVNQQFLCWAPHPHSYFEGAVLLFDLGFGPGYPVLDEAVAFFKVNHVACLEHLVNRPEGCFNICHLSDHC